MILLSFCSFPWWLSWLLPFLLGLALGWALWSKYKSMAADLESQVNSLNGRIGGLEGDVNGHLSRIADLEGELSIAKGKLREAELQLADCLNSKGNKGAATIATTSATAAAASAISATSTSKGSGPKSIYAGLKANNLQIIEGIGPKMEEVLKENGIDTWTALSNNDATKLRAVLDKYGDKYNIIDVTTWQQQAKHASDGDFEGLINMQKHLDGGSANTLSTSDSKLEKFLIKKGFIKQFKKDDLKAIEGIGPKIAGLLKDAGITTWQLLSISSADKLKEILNNAGSRYKLADPTTWPKQAEMAHEGKWDELREYQDFLQGGKE